MRSQSAGSSLHDHVDRREICPADEGDIIDTCGGLRADPVCRFIDQGCVPGAEVDGVCYLEELRFECDEEIAYDTYQQQTSLTCPVGDIRCNGNECIDIDRESNDGSNRGLAALAASQLLAFDSTCSDLDPDSCSVYPGDAKACQRGIGGIFDACELPAPSAPGPYLDLVFSIGGLDTNLTVLNTDLAVERRLGEAARSGGHRRSMHSRHHFATPSNTVSASTIPNADDIAAERISKRRVRTCSTAPPTMCSTHSVPLRSTDFFSDQDPTASLQSTMAEPVT